MEHFTSDDIKALREYLDKLEALRKRKPPERLTPEEWDEALKAIEQTGKIPAKYAGRIGETEIKDPALIAHEQRRRTRILTGKDETIKGYYDIAQEAFNRDFVALREEYQDLIDRVIIESIKGDEGGNPSIEEMIRQAVAIPQLLDVKDLPNLLITDEKLQYAITPKKNEFAYIIPFNYEQLEFQYDANGEIIIGTKAQYEAVESAKKKKDIKAAGIDNPLLRQLFAATMAAYLSNYGNSITVSLPAFAREMNIDIHNANKKAEGQEDKHNPNDFFKKLKALEGLNGVWQGGSFYRVFILESYNAVLNTLTFSSPWLFKIIRELLTNPTAKKTRADGSVKWEITGISSLMRASINSARSKPTVEIIATLLTGLKQRGVVPDAQLHPGRKYKNKDLVTYTVSFRTIIERTPLVMENLDACTPSNKTTLLQRYFCGTNAKERAKENKGYILEEYIDRFTFIKQYYKDFKIQFSPPTVKTLDEVVKITHNGINGEFERNNPLAFIQKPDTPGGEV